MKPERGIVDARPHSLFLFSLFLCQIRLLPQAGARRSAHGGCRGGGGRDFRDRAIADRRSSSGRHVRGWDSWRRRV